jgi:hypothetical protein
MFEFNKNETTLYLVMESALHLFKLNEKDKNKQTSKLAFQDRKATSAILMEDLGQIIISDT